MRVGNGDTANGVKCAAISTDGGSTWSPVLKQPSGVTGGGSVAVPANGGGFIWSTEGAGVQVTTNGAKAWKASSGIPANALVASDRVNPDKIYGFGAGVFYVSTDGGSSFAATVSTGLPSTAQIKAVPGHEGDIWLAGGEGASYGLWRSTDSGGSFTKLANVQAADTVGFGKAAPGQSYVAVYISAQIEGVRGIFRSIDAGASWARVNDDTHQWGWTGKTITGDPRVYGRVYVGTNGRGIVYGQPATP